METIEIELSRIFVKVVQHGGFSRAAQFLKIPKSTVSKALAKLEKKTATKLLTRTTRSQTLTVAGQVFYEKCLGPIQSLEDAQRSLFGQDNIISGPIKISAPEDIGSYLLSPIITELSKKYPNLSFELFFTSRMVNIVKEGFDFAIRTGTLTESRLKARKIGHLNLVLVASPQYLNQHFIHSQGKAIAIRKPIDLLKHRTLSLSSSLMTKNWKLKNGKETVDVPISGFLESNSMTSLLKMSLSGAGITLLPKYMCETDLKNKNLIQVLPDWINISPPISIVSAHSLENSARLKVVSDFIVSSLQKKLF